MLAVSHVPKKKFSEWRLRSHCLADIKKAARQNASHPTNRQRDPTFQSPITLLEVRILLLINQSHYWCKYIILIVGLFIPINTLLVIPPTHLSHSCTSNTSRYPMDCKRAIAHQASSWPAQMKTASFGPWYVIRFIIISFFLKMFLGE